ncbi:hypothetical protein [Aeoliella sp. SH292]|uniref:hypothetical protein n=1 Tax=Aeoliella sp. SH292 TaxID=3454464 RepID=UPI003F9CB08D
MDRTTFQLCQAAIALLLLANLLPNIAWGHGSPAHVDGSTGKLVVTGNVTNPIGFAGEVFADAHPDAALFAITSNRLFTDLPGFDVTNVTPGSGLWIEPISRPDRSLEGSPERWLWYWSASTSAIASVPTGQQLQLVSARGFGDRTVTEFGDAPGSLQFMEPFADDLGEHVHSLYYIVQNASASAGQSGAYAFFARLTSPAYEPSDPFLVVLPNSLTSDQLLEAATEINEAALSIQPGDFNGDGIVSLADYTVWRDNLGAADESLIGSAGDGQNGVDSGDYDLWRANFGSPKGIPVYTMKIPEPRSAISLAALLLLFGTRANRRRTPIPGPGQPKRACNEAFSYYRPPHRQAVGGCVVRVRPQ